MLRLHREIKELPVFALVAAKGGLRLKPTKLEGGCAAHFEIAKCSDIRRGPFSLDVTAIRMDVFIETLSWIVGRAIVDRTGFQGIFGAHLEFAPDDLPFTAPPGSRGRGGDAETISRPSLSTALREQLGLRLESTKGQVEVLVIDSVEKPSVN